MTLAASTLNFSTCHVFVTMPPNAMPPFCGRRPPSCSTSMPQRDQRRSQPGKNGGVLGIRGWELTYLGRRPDKPNDTELKRVLRPK
jgi:hypothetical protein